MENAFFVHHIILWKAKHINDFILDTTSDNWKQYLNKCRETISLLKTNIQYKRLKIYEQSNLEREQGHNSRAPPHIKLQNNWKENQK